MEIRLVDRSDGREIGVFMSDAVPAKGHVIEVTPERTQSGQSQVNLQAWYEVDEVRWVVNEGVAKVTLLGTRTGMPAPPGSQPNVW